MKKLKLNFSFFFFITCGSFFILNMFSFFNPYTSAFGYVFVVYVVTGLALLSEKEGLEIEKVIRKVIENDTGTPMFIRQILKKLKQDRRAMADLSKKFIGLAVGLLVLSYTVPLSITALFAVNTTTWSAEAVAIWNVLPVISVLATFIMIVAYAVLSD